MEETNWVLQINDELNSNATSSIIPENEKWRRHSIYKVPFHVTELNKKAYKPKTVSFGPYHHGEEQLKGMEEHKHRALVHFLKRSKKPIELVFQRMDQVVDKLRDSYEPLDPIWTQDTTKFLKMMILDGCFMLEILRASDCVPEDYAENDPVFSEHGKLYVVPFIQRDMLMLENQLPMKVLRILIEVETGTFQDYEFLNKQILRFFCNPCPIETEREERTKIRSIGKCLHVLDVFRKNLIQQGATHTTRVPRVKRKNRARGEENIVLSAAELHEAGIRFLKSKTQSLRDVSFDDGFLRLPTINIDDTAEYMFLNLMAFERLHFGAGNDITSYIYFMDKIINTEIDVGHLHRKGILINALGSHKDVAKLFNSLSKDITVDRHGVLDLVQMSMSNYCKKPWNMWRSNLTHTYFRNPWAIASLVAAMFLFTLTIIQTVYTIAEFYQPEGPSSTSVIPRPRPFPHA